MTSQKPLINHQNPSSLLPRGWVLILLTFVCFGLLPGTKASDVESALPNGNTADGDGALLSLTTGFYNSAFGFLSVLSITDASFDTGIGAGALLLDTEGTNTAVGAGTLLNNTTGFGNNAFGTFALFNNIGGFFNNAHGRNCLLNSDGDQNNAFGDEAMIDTTTGSFNTAMGDDALASLVDGSSNVAVGDEAGNGCEGCNQGIYIGAGVGPVAVDELRFIRIGDTSFTDYDFFAAGIFGRAVDAGTANFVFADDTGKIGTVPLDANGNKVSFKPQAMLDESLKQQKRIAELETTVLRQQKGMEVLTAQLKEQAAQIQRVSAQLEVNKHAPQVVANKP